ncbi:MAG: hypothetical protein Q7W13_00615 [Bacteroidia bacterium]|nr:hypothetical protein [Bacteroidia bacterium]
MTKNTIIITTVGLVIGTAEALLYYNLGKNAGGKFTYNIPPTKEFLKTVGVVLVTSILTAGISGMIESRFNDEEKQTV